VFLQDGAEEDDHSQKGGGLASKHVGPEPAQVSALAGERGGRRHEGSAGGGFGGAAREIAGVGAGGVDIPFSNHSTENSKTANLFSQCSTYLSVFAQMQIANWIFRKTFFMFEI